MARGISDDMDERLTALLSAEEADDAAADRRLRTAEPGPATHRSTLLTVCPFILGNEFCERLAYYGLATNLITYLRQEMGAQPAFAAIMVQLFEGTCYLTPLLGAWLADSHWGRYKTILVFSCIYMVGMILLTGSTLLNDSNMGDSNGTSKALQKFALYGALYVVALGTGGIKPNVSAFGADQFNMANAQDRKEKESFFNFFYLSINLGSLVAVTVLVYIQDNISWTIGFGIPSAAMAIAMLLFVAGSPRYTHVQPTESPMARVVCVVRAAVKNRFRKKAPELHRSGGYDGPVNLPPDVEGLRGAMRKMHSYMWLEDAIGDDSLTVTATSGLVVPGYSPAQVEEVRLVLRLLPVFLTTILYWTVYAQMGTFFIMQGSQMDREMFNGRFFVPAASLSLFNIFSIVALIPVYDRVFVPLLARFGRKLTLLQRIGWGLVVCALAMFAAAAVEWRRLQLFQQGHYFSSKEPGMEHMKVVDMSVFWQIPQYLLVGISEILASIGQLEFFYDQAPDVMRSCSMALQLLSVAVGSYLSGALVYVVGRYSVGTPGAPRGWLPDDLNRGRVDLFFLFLAVLMLLNLVIFLRVAMRYVYKSVPRKREAPVHNRPRWYDAQEQSNPTNFPGRQRSPDLHIGGSSIPPDEDVGIYGRSVTYQPASPMLPAPYR